jgi:hypothetical protein
MSLNDEERRIIVNLELEKATNTHVLVTFGFKRK